MTRGGLAGRVDVISASEVYGWAANLAAPSEPVSIELHVGGRKIAELACGDARADAIAAGFTGARSFHYQSLGAEFLNPDPAEFEADAQT